MVSPRQRQAHALMSAEGLGERLLDEGGHLTSRTGGQGSVLAGWRVPRSGPSYSDQRRGASALAAR